MRKHMYYATDTRYYKEFFEELLAKDCVLETLNENAPRVKTKYLPDKEDMELFLYGLNMPVESCYDLETAKSALNCVIKANIDLIAEWIPSSRSLLFVEFAFPYDIGFIMTPNCKKTDAHQMRVVFRRNAESCVYNGIYISRIQPFLEREDETEKYQKAETE